MSVIGEGCQLLYVIKTLRALTWLGKIKLSSVGEGRKDFMQVGKHRAAGPRHTPVFKKQLLLCSLLESRAQQLKVQTLEPPTLL